MFFDLFSNNEYVSCEELEYGIHFDYTGLFHCCEFFLSYNNNDPIAPIIGDINQNFKQFCTQKNLDRKSHKEHKIISRCQDCYRLEKKKWKQSKKIKSITISTIRRCNCDCSYCTTHINKEFFNQTKEIPIYDFLIKLYKKNIFDKNCKVLIGGGEPTLHFEFEKIMRFFLDKTKANIRVLSSGIIYSSVIEEAIKKSRCLLCISIDSGNRELYKKIKNVDAFDIVVKNIRKYSKAQINAIEPNQVFPKYIIIPSINDTTEQIEEFINLTRNLRVMSSRLDIESNWYRSNKNNLDIIRKYLYLFKFYKVKSKEKNLYPFYNDSVISLINKYKKEYEEIEIV